MFFLAGKYCNVCFIKNNSTELNLQESIASSFDYTDGQKYPDNTEPLEIPKELWLLIDHLNKYGKSQVGFMKALNPNATQILCNILV